MPSFLQFSNAGPSIFLRTFGLFFLLVYGVACKKAAAPIPAPPVVDNLPKANAITAVSIDQLNFTVSYTLNFTTSATGVTYATDSISLVKNAGTDVNSFVNTLSYLAKIALKAYPADNKVWYQVYFFNSSGTKVYSKIYRHEFSLWQVQNKYIVNGLAIDNNHSKDGLVTFDQTPYTGLDNSLTVSIYMTGYDYKGYKAKINGINAPLGKFIDSWGVTEIKKLVFDVPENIPIGNAKFELYNYDKLVYSADVMVVNGGLLSKVLHPIGNNQGGDYVVHNNELYTYINRWVGSGTEQPQFHKWSPATYTWTKLPNPPETRYSEYNGGQSINGLIYFCPNVRDYGNTYPFLYEEWLWTFNPANNVWKKTILSSNGPSNQTKIDEQFFGCFSHGGKLYCLLSYKSYGTYYYEMHVYDPADNSWKKFMDLPNDRSSITVYKTVVNNGKAYLLISKRVSSAYSGTVTKNQFFEMDMNTKTLIPRNWITDPGRNWVIINDNEFAVAAPNLASYRGKIYVYGGGNTIFSSIYSSVFAVYDPDANTWSSVSGYSYYTGWVSNNYGYFGTINDKLYVGFGYDRQYIESAALYNLVIRL